MRAERSCALISAEAFQSRPKAGFQRVPPLTLLDFRMSLTASWQHAKRKSGRSGGSQMFPEVQGMFVMK